MRPLSGALATGLLLFGLLVGARGQCNNTECTAPTNCNKGFGTAYCRNATLNVTTTGVCYYATHCTAYSQQAGDLFLNLKGPSPDKINRILTKIQQAVVDAYNLICNAGKNYLLCCPGSIDWPNQANQSKSVFAMSSIAELPIASIIGSVDTVTMVFRLQPNSNSSLCNALTYPTPMASTTMAAATATTTKAVGGANATAGVGATTVPAVGSNSSMASSTVTVASASGNPSSAARTTAAAAAAAANVTTAAPAAVPATSGSSTPVAAAVNTATITPAAASATTTRVAAPAATTTTTPIAAPPVSTVGATGTPPMTTTGTAMTTVKSGRRRRDVYNAANAEEPSADAEAFLERVKRAVASSGNIVALSASAIQNLTANINITGYVQSVLLDNNITAVATVSAATDAATTVTVGTTPVTVGRKSAEGLSRYSAATALTVVALATAALGIKSTWILQMSI